METLSPTSHERRICEYPESACSHVPCIHPRSFLCLPQSLRRRIYYEAGLYQERVISFSRPPKPPPPPPRQQTICIGGQMIQICPMTATWKFPNSTTSVTITYNLLFTCRTIYAEASSILYSASKFFIQYSDSQSLRALRNLTPHALSCLTHLTVHLNVASCGRWRCCIFHPGLQCRCQHDQPLAASSSQHQGILSEWQSTASYVTAHIKPSRLQLHFICDVEDLETGMCAVEPFLTMPLLADCSIRLSHKSNRALLDLARKMATRAVGNCLDEPTSAFRFLDLPLELRRQILEYTDLVTPLCEVEWNPEKGFYVPYSQSNCIESKYETCPPAFHYACQFRHCWYRSSGGCYCRRYHSAFSFSPKCNCWSLPISLFLVCRAMQEDVQAVFFMKNRFVITPAKGCTSVPKSTPSRLEISIFLTSIVPSNALGLLRFIEVVFPPFDEDYLRPHEPAYQDWLQTIDYVKDKLYLPTLTLRVYMADHAAHGNNVTLFRRRITKEQQRTILSMWVRTFRPLSKLNGMNRFFAHITLPYSSTPRGRRDRNERPDWYFEENRQWDQRVERLVMGDDYDSTLLKENEVRDSQWLVDAQTDQC
jgi:hypothetical protein